MTLLHPTRRSRRNIKGRFSGRLSGQVRGHHKVFRMGRGFFYQVIASLGDYAVFTMDSGGNISSWNDAAKDVFGYSENEVIGKPFDLLFSEADRRGDRPKSELEIAKHTGRAVDETWHVRKGGTKFWAYGAVFPLLDAGGAIRGYTKIAQDLTKGKIREESAQSAAELSQTITDAIPALIAYISPQHRFMFHN